MARRSVHKRRRREALELEFTEAMQVAMLWRYREAGVRDTVYLTPEQLRAILSPDRDMQ